MILNYSFLCHSHLLFSEDLCPPVCETVTIHSHSRSVYLQLDIYIKLCGSVYLRLERRDVENGIGGR